MMNPSSSIDPEFAEGASDPGGLSRKEFLRLMGASLALAGAGACTRPLPEKIVPYVRQPEGLTPGEAQWYATAMEHGDDVLGLLVKSHEGRPTKIEGNPAHPGSLGRSSVHMQAALLDLYDPDRSQVVRHRGQPSTWEAFLGVVTQERRKWARNGGEGVRFLTQPSHSLTQARALAAFLKELPKAKIHQHDGAAPINVDRTLYKLDEVDIVVSLEADFLGVSGRPMDIAHFASRRGTDARSLRLIVLESMPSLTGAAAGQRYALNPKELVDAAEQLEEMVTHLSETPWQKQPEIDTRWKTLASEAWAHKGRVLVLAGPHQPAAVHRATELLNRRLRSPAGHLYVDSTDDGFGLLFEEIAGDDVTALIILDGNPAYTMPGDLAFPALPAKVFTVHLGSYFDETAELCQWHIPESHFLESWDVFQSVSPDALSVAQPLIEPLYSSRTASELISALTGKASSSYELARDQWQGTERHWRRTLHDGVAPPADVPVAKDDGPIDFSIDRSMIGGLAPAQDGTVDIIIRPDPHLLDGRYANNAWLQELPKPITRITWGNAIHLSPRTAEAFHLQQGDEVELAADDRKLTGSVWILPGHADGCATIHLGGGRWRAGRIGTGVGYNAAILQTARSPWLCQHATLKRTGQQHTFATSQHQQDMAGRAPIWNVKAGEDLAPVWDTVDSLYPAVKYASPSWGMAIDLNTCTGCGTCTIACQAENNIPVVGRAEVLRGRAMHWIRVDHYIEGTEQPQYLHQPVPCMHCENAPCEVVCPVAATVHDHQGLNLMVYNRCVGTRYCSNNCPYKVRRFNFFQYADLKSPQLKLQRNPEVTVRERGVMEKCTYCVQRITAARVTADVENRAIRDGEVVPACAQACPANSIAFGDIMDPTSKVSAARRDPRHYALLGELNTRPRTTYLARMEGSR